MRSAALVATGALVTHRLRYLAGYGDGAEEALAHHGHAYLPLVVGATTVALCLAAAGVLRALARARREGRVEDPPPPFVRLWLRSSAAISILYALQETLEGLLAPGHAGGLTGVVGDGGWSAFLFAIALGALVALLVRGAGAAVVRAADRPSSPRVTPGPARRWWPRPAAAVGGRPIAIHRAGRGPPPLLP